MTILQRILLQVAFGAGLVIAVATAATYGIVHNGAKQGHLKHLATYVTERSRREEIGFQQVEANLTLVRGQFLKRLESPVPYNYEKLWNERFELFPDGAWRSRKEFADGRKYSTLWANKKVKLTPDLQTQILCAQDICDEFLPGWMESFPSLYFVLPGWLNIGFDPRIPNWVWDTPADYDPSALEWFQLAMLTNLLSNAVKYSPPDQRVDFNVQRDGDHAICRVADHGYGIPEADQARLFQAFHRGSNVQQIPGTGPGLLIVRRCVDLHGGKIQFESVEGQGTTFTVMLPLFALAHTPTPTPTPQSPDKSESGSERGSESESEGRFAH